jgi:hypothetical protein
MKQHSQNVGVPKYGKKLSSGCVCKMYLKDKQILCLDLGPILKVSHYAYENSPKPVLFPSTLDKGHSTAIFLPLSNHTLYLGLHSTVLPMLPTAQMWLSTGTRQDRTTDPRASKTRFSYPEIASAVHLTKT